MLKNIKTLLVAALIILTVAGCSSPGAQSEPATQASSSTAQVSGTASSAAAETSTSSANSSTTAEAPSSAAAEVAGDNANEAATAAPADGSSEQATAPAAAGTLAVHFGDDGAEFTMNLYGNSTAATIASYVGTADWRLPIYEFEGYDNWEVMQYYDLPSRYEIPSNAETVTSQKAGEVYYSEPNRMVLFYGDAEVTGEYTKVGYFDATEAFVSAVQDNPVLVGWGNKIVLIKD